VKNLRILEAAGFDHTDPADLFDFVMWSRNVFLWITFVIVSIIMTYAIFKDGVPPEPQWWLDFETAIGVTW
jgi:hypothetical protein